MAALWIEAQEGLGQIRLSGNDALRRFVGDELTDISAGGRFSRGSYAGPLGLRRQKAARMQARMQPVGANGPVNLDPRGAIRGSGDRYTRIMTALHRRNWAWCKSKLAIFKTFFKKQFKFKI